MTLVKTLGGIFLLSFLITQQATAQIRSGEIELFLKNSRIEIQVSNGEEKNQPTIGGVVADDSTTESQQNDSFIGAGAGPVFAGARQYLRSHKYTDLTDTVSTDLSTQEVFGSVSIPTIALPGDQLDISFIQESGTDTWSKDLPDHTYFTDINIKTSESRLGVIYMAKFIGIGYWRGQGDMDLQDISASGADILEKISYTTHDTLVGMKMDEGNGFIINAILLDSDSELEPGLVYTVRVRNSEEQALELGYRFSENSKTTIFYGLTDQNFEVIQFDTAIIERIKLNRGTSFYGMGMQIGDFGISVKQESFEYNIDEIIGGVFYDGNQSGTLNSISVNWDF